jgi:spore coat polysaccharide biosynthesis predicted glycosyltransferase SpsG/GNAT superfamily N-acetyltransferase
LKSLFIRADAGGKTGTGHVMRMLALAQAYQRRGGRVVFICAKIPEALEARLIQEGCEVLRISVKPGSAEDAQATLAVVRGQGAGGRKQEAADGDQQAGDRGQEAISHPISDIPYPISHIPYPNSSEAHLQPEGRISQLPYPHHRWLIVDGYHFDYAYQKAIKACGLSLLCVDDHGYTDQWCCDAILNQNLDAEKHMQYDNEITSFTPLLGASFCLLRQEFLQPKKPAQAWSQIHQSLITLGGSDPDNATEAVLRLLNQASQRPLHIRVLAGADNPHVSRLRAFESHHQIEVLQNTTNMPEQYAWADGIISAGGSTCWEWLYYGLPGAVVSIAENQLPIINALAETRQAALSLGWFNEAQFKNQALALARWLETPAEICDVEVTQGLIDGYGPDRVADFLLGSKVTVREARREDCAQYLVWANNPEVRQNSFSPEPISEASHVKWFSRRIGAPDCCLLVVSDFAGNAVGQVRFDFNEDKGGWVIDFSIDSRWRGKGIGKASLTEALNWMHHYYPNQLVVFAEVLELNPASKKIFEALEFKITSTYDHFTSYSLAL